MLSVGILLAQCAEARSTYLRSTMSQERLNNLMILHVHKELTDALDLVHVANEFVRANESRVRSFGKF